MKKHSLNNLIENLKQLGLKQGDTVLIRGDVGKIGRTENKISEDILNAFFQVIGEEGTIITLTFTEQFLLPLIDKNYVFAKKTPSKSGAFARIILNFPDSLRSSHPTSSFAAIGKNAEYLLNGHDEKAHAYLPIQKLIEVNGKMLIVGCIDNSPGFTTVHLAQENLGLSSKTFLKNLVGVYYEKNGQKKLYKRNSIGGCSMGFSNFYEEYKNQNKLISGVFGNAESFLINAKDAYQVEYDLLKVNPKFALCNDPYCKSCRGIWFYNMKEMPAFYIRILKKVLLNILNKDKSCNK
ncbi:MAG: AAC(3) family N-acetyltransferase [bacterium]